MSTENIQKPDLEVQTPEPLKLKLKANMFFVISWGTFFGIILTLCIIALILTGAFPCVHTKCHSHAQCFNRLFYGECVCNYGYAGNGRDHCDECGVTLYQNNADNDGQRAVPYSWPATAIIEYMYTTLVKFETERVLIFDEGMCSGVLINRKYILTSANCFDNVFNYYDYRTDKNYKIKITTNNFHPTLESIYNIYTGTDSYVYYYTDLAHVEIDDFTQVKIHPEFNPDTMENNLALVKLSEDAILNRYIQITCLPNMTSSNIPHEGLGKNNLYIAGYSSAGSSYVTWELQNLLIDMYNNSMCDQVHPEYKKNWDRQFCAGEYNDYGNTTGQCHGDYGSSLYQPQLINNKTKYVTVGLLSYDVPCKVLHSPAVYTRVSYYLDWINENSKY